jgi:hypothetical protein
MRVQREGSPALYIGWDWFINEVELMDVQTTPHGSRRDSWWEGARRKADRVGGYRSPEKTNQIPIPALQISVLSKRLYLASSSNRSRLTEKEGNRKKAMPTQSRRKKPVQQGPTVQDEDGLDCHVKAPEGRDKVGSCWNRPSPTPSCQSNSRDWSPAGTNYSLPPVRKNGVTPPRLPHLPSGTSRSKTIKVDNCRKELARQEETLDYHGPIVPSPGRSAKAACRARRKRRQTIEKAKRKERQSLQATIKDDEPICLSKSGAGPEPVQPSTTTGCQGQAQRP